MKEEGLIAPIKQIDDTIDNGLRPLSLDDFIGQEQCKENLRVFIEAAKQRGECLDHILFYGPPGLGKTTLAQIIAREMGVSFRATAGPILSKSGDLAAILTNLQENDVLFIDEIHRLNPIVEEVLYPAMEDFKLDLIIGEGPAARTIRIDVPKFTLIGATTRLGMLANPLRDRFGIPARLNFYEVPELHAVIKRAAGILNVEITQSGANEIAKRSRGTPRIAVRLLKRVRDFASVAKVKSIDEKIADKALTKLEVDGDGLDGADRRYLRFIAEFYAGGPVGIETISAGLSEQRDSIEETIEPYLLQQGFVQRTSRGRMLTPAAYKNIGIAAPANASKHLDLIAAEEDV